MKQQIQIEVPKDWSAVTLKQYLNLKNDMEAYKDEPDAITACMFQHLCNFPIEYIDSLDVDVHNKISNDLSKLLDNVQLPLQRFITIDGVEYGFEPNLSKMSYGAYVDIAKYEELTIDSKWAEIMSILYRPITKRFGNTYDIKKYEAVINGTPFLNVTMDIHFGTLFFFISLSKDLQSSILKSLTQTSTEISPSIKSILEKSGNLTHHLSNLQTEISSKWKKSQTNH